MWKKRTIALFSLVFVFWYVWTGSAYDISVNFVNDSALVASIVDIENLYGYEINFFLDGDIADVQHSEFLGDSASATYSYSFNTGTNGSVYGSRLDSGQSGVSGSGELFNMTFDSSATLWYSLVIFSNGTEAYKYYNGTPETPAPQINSTDGSNKTLQDLHCFTTLIDSDNGKMNVSVNWYNQSGRQYYADYNQSFANGTFFDAVLSAGNTSKGQVWNCSVQTYDGVLESSVGWSGNLTIENTLPVVTLISPASGTETTDRTPFFNWSVSDDDGVDDVRFYEINITSSSAIGEGGTTCSQNINNASVSERNYTSSLNLQCLYDLDAAVYNWTVRANDTTGWGSYSEAWMINVTSLLDLYLLNDNVTFGDLNLFEIEETTDDSPAPLVLRNIGNVLLNISVNSSDLWVSFANPNNNYMFKVDNVTGYEGSYYNASSDFTPMPETDALAISGLNYSIGTDRVEVDLYLEVPADEQPGAHIANIFFIGELGE